MYGVLTMDFVEQQHVAKFDVVMREERGSALH